MEPTKTIEEKYHAWQSERVALHEEIIEEFNNLVGKIPLIEVAQMLGFSSPKTISTLKNPKNMRSFAIEKRFYYLQKLKQELNK